MRIRSLTWCVDRSQWRYPDDTCLRICLPSLVMERTGTGGLGDQLGYWTSIKIENPSNESLWISWYVLHTFICFILYFRRMVDELLMLWSFYWTIIRHMIMIIVMKQFIPCFNWKIYMFFPNVPSSSTTELGRAQRWFQVWQMMILVFITCKWTRQRGMQLEDTRENHSKKHQMLGCNEDRM